MLLTYDEYTQQFNGELDSEVFEEYEYEAEALVHYMTFSRLKKVDVIPEEVKRLVNHLIGLAQRKAASLTLGASVEDDSITTDYHITNQSNDGVSVSYNGMKASEMFALCRIESMRAIRYYLDGVEYLPHRKLLYRGLYPGE